MKIHFNFTPKFGHNLRDKLGELIYNEEFIKYLSHMQGKEIRMELKPAVRSNTKQALYDFYHGPLMAVVISTYTDAGYELMDEVKCDYLLKAEFAKGTMTTPNGEEVYLLDKSKMNKDRLVKFVNDVITHLEMDFGVPPEKIPDAKAYKELMNTGENFDSIKKFKKEEE